MGRIKKAATERHMATLSPFIKDFVKQATEVPLYQLPALLESFPQLWPFPRGDLYHWIPVLDRFDHILELFCKEYALNEGPQTQPFEQRLLQKGDAEENMPYSSVGGRAQELGEAGFSVDGDRELVEAILQFSRVLLEKCGNRSLYASSGHINDLLNTTSLNLLRLCLKLSLRLAQRYQVARYKNHHPSAQAVLLANHYNINLESLHKIAMPFPKPYSLPASAGQTPATKGKERSTSAVAFNPADLVAIAKEPISTQLRQDLSNVALSYYEPSQSVTRPDTAPQAPDASPASPSIARRTSNLGPSRDRPAVGDRSANDVSSTPVKSRESDETPSSAPKIFQIPADEVAERSACSLLHDALPNVPKDSRYDLLNRVRIAKAFASQETTPQQLLEVRLLAIANLASAYNESKFQEKIGAPDGEEPRRFHLAQQLCDLLQPATANQMSLTLQSEITVLSTLEALSKSRHKVTEVADALGVTVNHGALYYELRKVVASLHAEEHSTKKAELIESEWRDAAFELVNNLQQTHMSQRYGERLVTSGVMAILIEPLSLRTTRAERFHEKVLQFFDSVVHNVPSGFQTLADVKGLDIIADLTAYEVDGALENVRTGRGLPSEYKSKVVDYAIPFHQQATLRQLFKNTVHMFEQHNAGTHDRLLRNLIDTPQILGALRNVIENAQVFGANVWSGAVNIVSNFIHNEPTSYQVIGEAGLSKSLLESITGNKVPDELPSLEDFVPSQETPEIKATESGDPSYPSVPGILPIGEVLCDIPNAFGAICLNESGMQLFQASGALSKYFDVFLSPQHVRAMEDEGQTAATIGHSFDELSRHHPRLKDQIMAAVINMLKRLKELCAILAAKKHSGAKLWQAVDGKIAVSGGQAALEGAARAELDQAISGGGELAPPQSSTPIEDDGTEDARERATAAPYLSACFKFLDTFCQNASMCTLFCEESGAELLLDLAVSPSIPYDLVAFPLFNKSSQVLKSMCEAKAHLVLPSIIRRMQHALLSLRWLMGNKRPASSFRLFTDLSEPTDSGLPNGIDGTTVVKSLVNVHLLTHVLGRILAPPTYSLRHHPASNALFSSLNFTEIYLEFVDQLSQLHASCVWESLLLMHDLPDARKAGTEPRPFIMRRTDANGIVEIAGEKNAEAARGEDAASGSNERQSRQSVLAQKNLRTIRYLLNQVPMGIESFLHSLGQAIATKGNNSKEHGTAVSRRIAKALTWELDFRRDAVVDESLETKYIASILAMIGRMLLRNSYSMEAFGTKEALNTVLRDFYLAGGLTRMNDGLERFVGLLAKQQEDGKIEGHVRDALHSILNFYNQIVRQKCIHETTQQQPRLVQTDKKAADYFNASQLILEARDAILPAVSKIWHSKEIEKINDSDVKLVVDILQLILKADGEDHSHRRVEHAMRRPVPEDPSFTFTPKEKDSVHKLETAVGVDASLAAEALYRCNHHVAAAEAYSRLRLKDDQVPRFPVPQETEVKAQLTPAKAQDTSEDAEMADASKDDSMPGLEAVAEMTSGAENPISSNDHSTEQMQPHVTKEDLDEKRTEVRDDLIDRCLEVLSTQPSLTFELADLIQAAVANAGDGSNARADIGTTLVLSLMSLHGQEPSKEYGAKIHAYAHLVGLILQDREFFDSILDELKESFETLVSWVQLEQDQKIEDAPWVETILLIVERVLAEDEQPTEVEWRAPPSDDPLKPMPLPPAADLVVSTELRSQLFDALVEMLPKIGKNKSLALSVSRVLVILTRRRDLAARLSDKPRMGRLFLMVRQLAGFSDEKVQSSLLLILRHLVEDEDMIRQIMRAEVRVLFENHRSSRAVDTTTYAKNMHHLVLRSPQIFVEVTQEMLEIARFDGTPQRAQTLALKKPPLPTFDAPEDSTTDANAPSTSNAETSDADARKSIEPKPPVVEGNDGVIQFLLRELTNYRDVEDKPALAAKDSQGDDTLDTSSTDVEMTDAVAATGNAVPEASSQSKTAFKAEEHPIFVYRCFLLQCLAELLSSYNRTKVEFINFSRTKPEPPATTPSKPRAGTLRYLLETLLPVGTLEHRDDVAHRKRVATSHWANAVLVALCTKTQERHLKDAQDPSKFAEQEPELTFVRKFVCEHALKSFANAMGGPSPVDERYSRLLALGELFNRMLNDKVDLHRSNLVAAGMYAAQQQIGRLMYERGFIGTLTSAIAELDLNFPNAKRTVKYILNPLKHLTDLGVAISQSSDSSTEPGASTEEDDISSATSEDDEDEREQTPDMYRGSSLGIFEAAGNEDDESDSESADEDEDEEMYEEAYDEEMEYDEEPAAEHGDVVSDEDDDGMDDDMGEIEGVPGDIEMQLDIVEDDDDEDEDEEDSDDEEEDDDSGGDIDFADQMDEITGDDENASMNEHDEGDWEDDFHGHGAPHDGGSPHGGPLEHIAHVLGAEDPSEAGDQDGVVHIDMGGEEEFFEDEMPPEDEEDEDEIDYGEDMIYEPEMEDDEDEEEDGGWAWDANPVGMGAPAILRGGHVHHHHHHHRGFPEMFSMMAGEGLRPTGAGFRSHHRSTPNARDEDGINPLLQRDSASANAQRDRDSLDMHPRGPRRALLPRGGDAILQDIVAAVGPAGHGGGGIVNINVDGAVQGLSALPPMFAVQHGQGGAHAMIDLDPRRSWRDQLSLGRWPDMVTGGRSAERNATSHSEVQAVEFRVATTTHRWQEEARMLFPGGKAQEKAVRIANRLLRALVPAAMEAKRVREKKEAQRRAAEEKAAEEARKKLEAEKAEREAQEKKEREEREAREREEAEMRAREEAEEAEQAAAEAATEAAQVESEAQGDAESSMEGVEHDAEAGTSDEPSTEAPQDDAAAGERVTINIRGRELDITSLGIDREYIEALPEDMREEVVMAQVAEQRSQQVESGEGPSEISREFLEALPREIQQELIRSEQMERRRREREETRRRATQEGAAAQPEEMNNADFMAMLDPTLRRAILMEADDSVLSALPEELQAEARALFGDRRPRGDAAGRLGRGLEPAGARVLNGQLGARHTSNAEYGGREVSRQRRPVAQMLDKAGIATLLRLMFVSLNHKSKSNLHSILSDVCKNTQNRAEVISILLAILQDGTSDVNAVERSFAQLSLRAKTPPSATPRTPQPPKRTLTAPITELSPLNIVQQCLGTLNALSNDNQRVNSFFLSEHETSISQKTKAGKKGKGPESKAVKYPLNALLTLLDRKLITENTSVMETLASLLSTVTRPLTMLLRRAKEAQDEAEKAKTETETTAATDERPETSTSDVPMEEATPAEEQPSADAESSVNANDAPSAEATNEGKAEADPQTEVEDKKKHRDLVPPEVPDENIRLVVNILAARECPSKTFSDTLDIIKNMSAIPGAKEVFGKELIRQAQELGQALLEGLDDLAKHINAAETGTDVQGMALASFSSAGAKQRRLLRVLVALDHLFDPKRMPQAQPTSPNTSGSDIDQQLKEEILATLYESATFDKLWQSLSACLTAIRQRGNMVNIATILLPLIESLMVVCRNSTLKETAESSGTPPPPEARMETLFFNFTEDHRKILNELVRNNPKLMNGNLSVMAKNSKVLEFDNKRNYFSRQLRDRRAEVRVPHPSLQLSVRRDNVFLDSFKSLYFKTPDEIKFGKLNIRFHGEEGIDAGGVSREWFAAMARQMFNPDYALFNPVASDRTTFHPNSLSQVNPEHLMFFKFIGRIIGKALYENRVLDCHFSRAVYRKILGKSVSLKDMETLDLDYYKSLVWMLENDITDVAFETFSFEVDKFGVTETVDLMPGGRDIAVTEENKHEYVRLVVEYKLLKSVQEQLDHFLEGFHEIIPSHLISIFNEQELELLISGLPDIDVDDWKNNTEYHNYQPTSAQIQWFWRAVRSFDKEEKAKLLQFVTGTSKVPLNGFKELEGMNGHAKFNIHRDYSSKEKLPSSHTCFNQLDLPEYESYEHLRQQLYTAITAGSEYFGFA